MSWDRRFGSTQQFERTWRASRSPLTLKAFPPGQESSTKPDACTCHGKRPDSMDNSEYEVDVKEFKARIEELAEADVADYGRCS